MDEALFTAIDNITEDKPSNTDIDPDVLIKNSESFKSTNSTETESEDNESNENSEENSEKEISEKPWKIDANGKKVSTMIPKERFDEKNNLAKKLEAELRERDERLAKIEEENKKINVDLSHIKPENFDKFEDYMAELMRESNKIQRKIAKEELENERLMERVKTAETNLVNGFAKNVEDTVSEIPDIVNVVNEFTKYKNYLPAETIYTLMGDENSAKVIHEIMTTENLLRDLTEMSPAQAGRIIGKISAKIDVQKEYQKESPNNRSQNIREIPSTPIQSKPKVAGSPKLNGANDKSNVREESNSRIISKKESEEFAKLFSSR